MKKIDKCNILVWFGVVFVRSGLYEDGIFRFDIILPENFPEGDRPVYGYIVFPVVFQLLFSFLEGDIYI